MSLFGKKKETKEETKAPACTCGCDCACGETASADTAACCAEAERGICCIKVLGSGCKNCHALYENAQKAVADMGLNIETEYITDLQKVMEYGVMSMPALVVNDKVVGMGKVYKTDEIKKLLEKYKA